MSTKSASARCTILFLCFFPLCACVCATLLVNESWWVGDESVSRLGHVTNVCQGHSDASDISWRQQSGLTSPPTTSLLQSCRQDGDKMSRCLHQHNGEAAKSRDCRKNNFFRTKCFCLRPLLVLSVLNPSTVTIPIPDSSV